MGATISYALVGAATATATAPSGRILGVVALGVFSHTHAAVLNDVADYPIDRTEPRRAASPLVRGVISRRQALAFSLLNLALSAAVMALLAASGQAWVAWTVSLVLVDLYSVIGKRLRVAVGADVIQGIGTAFFVYVGAALTGAATAATLAAMVFVAGYVTMVNGVHGTVRDMGNDAAHGARTTALAFGAFVDESGRAVLPRSFVAWTVVLQFWLFTAATAFLVASRGALSRAGFIGAAGSALLLAALTVRFGAAALRSRGDRERMLAFGTWHLVVALATLVAIALWRMPPLTASIAIVGFVLPPKLFGWAVASPVRAG